MNRRLNPEIFGSSSEASHEMESQHYSAVAVRKLEEELKQSKKRISHLESLVEILQTQLKNVDAAQKQRTDAFSKALSELEKDLRDQDLRQARGLENMKSQIKDQRVMEGQVESLVERFNMSLMQFENKLSVLQKVLSEKEMSMMSYRNILEKIVDEVERLKQSRSHTIQRPLNR